jgi:hypothetical protein
LVLADLPPTALRALQLDALQAGITTTSGHVSAPLSQATGSRTILATNVVN